MDIGAAKPDSGLVREVQRVYASVLPVPSGTVAAAGSGSSVVAPTRSL